MSDMLRRQKKSLEAAFEEAKERALAELEDKLTTEKNNALASLKEEQRSAMTALKEEHSIAMTALKEEHSGAMTSQLLPSSSSQSNLMAFQRELASNLPELTDLVPESDWKGDALKSEEEEGKLREGLLDIFGEFEDVAFELEAASDLQQRGVQVALIFMGLFPPSQAQSQRMYENRTCIELEKTLSLMDCSIHFEWIDLFTQSPDGASSKVREEKMLDFILRFPIIGENWFERISRRVRELRICGISSILYVAGNICNEVCNFRETWTPNFMMSLCKGGALTLHEFGFNGTPAGVVVGGGIHPSAHLLGGPGMSTNRRNYLACMSVCALLKNFPRETSVSLYW